MLLRDKLSDFYSEMESLLREQGEFDLLNQLPNLSVTGRCQCNDSFCSSFTVEGDRKLHTVEKNIIGVHHGESVELQTKRGMIIIDTDNFGRIESFEVLGRSDISKALDKIGLAKGVY